MKIYLPFDFPQNPNLFMRRAGYGEHRDRHTVETSYTKRIIKDFYPRFHVYINTNKDNRVFLNLHLDQKKASYEGAHAHNAEYEGGRVEEEGNRLQGLIKNQMDNAQQVQQNETQGKKGFWQKLFD